MVAPPVIPFPLTSFCAATDSDLDVDNVLPDSNGVARSRRTSISTSGSLPSPSADHPASSAGHPVTSSGSYASFSGPLVSHVNSSFSARSPPFPTTPCLRRCAPTPTPAASRRSGPQKRAVSDIYDRDEDAPRGRSDARPRIDRSAVAAEAYRLRVEAEQRRRDELRDAFLRLIDTLPRGPTKLKTSKVSVLARSEYIVYFFDLITVF